MTGTTEKLDKPSASRRTLADVAWENASRGHEYLTRQGYDLSKIIDKSRLYITDPENCILAQLPHTIDYGYAIDRILFNEGLLFSQSTEWGHEHGMIASASRLEKQLGAMRPKGPDVDAYYDELTVAWTKLMDENARPLS
jgi:hypothetical protein